MTQRRMTCLRAWSILSLTICAVTVAAMAPGASAGRFPELSNEQAWLKMPRAEKGSGEPLPSWARTLAGPLPRTTAAMLRLDWVQRTRSPIDPKLRAQMRWVAAHANRCAYAEAYALFDAHRAGLEGEPLEALRRGDFSKLSPADQSALEFARKMTLDSASIGDAEFAALLQTHGEKQVTAMVLLMAYANFQDRLLLSLESPLEAGAPRPPIDVVFAPGSLNAKPGARPPGHVTPLPAPTGRDLIDDDPEWSSLSFDDLQAWLEAQRRKTARITIPDPEQLARSKPPGYRAAKRPSQWSLVCFGYQPELAEAWATCMSTFFSEAKLDMVFEEGLFWVTTRTIRCAYCMGHVEMGWELFGLNPSDVALRARLLAGNDWSSFPAHEQRAYAFARALTGKPWSVSTREIDSLKNDFGTDGAMIVIWAVSRCNYMTRVSNGFQLSLEQGNIFRDYFSSSPPRAETSKKSLGQEQSDTPK